MHNETSLASEIIKDILNEKSTILMELECLDVDFDKAAFVLTGVQETMESMQEPKTLDDGLVQYFNIQSSLVYLSVVFDYIKHIQTAIYDMSIRERKKDKEIREEGGNDKDYKKLAVEMIQNMDNEDCLFKIYHYILAKHRREEKPENGQ
ncbi:hypothetical protein [Blautia sp. XA-2221]|uniref:hypothetical protein n=1 Tax=Blautia sp. XA-2221 TaxID=2903961 RepID=UPI0023795E5B|nr:hypothetical protein [Blautia sp. XA-2221]